MAADAPADGTGEIDLGSCNFAAVSLSDQAPVYPGGARKKDEYHVARYTASGDTTTSTEAGWLARVRTERRRPFLYTLVKDIVAECMRREVGPSAMATWVASVRRVTALGTSGARPARSTYTAGRSTGSPRCSGTRLPPGITVQLELVRGTSTTCAVWGLSMPARVSSTGCPSATPAVW